MTRQPSHDSCTNTSTSTGGVLELFLMQYFSKNLRQYLLPLTCYNLHPQN
eukprot:m.41155 g.41155  ORF g.41155 m.41155 type:complete len:50 (-) comp14896_c0_seq4:290-439(-)